MIAAVALIRGLPRPMRLLVLGTFVNRVGTLIVPFLTLVLRRDFHLSPEATGVVVLGFGAGSVVSILVGGVLTDRLGRKRTLDLSLFGGGVLALAMSMAPTFTVFVPLLALFGFLSDLYRPASSAVIGDMLESDQRALGFAALRTAVNLGFAVGLAVGGVVADYSWRWLFAGDGLTTLVCAVFLHLALPETRPAPGASAPALEGAPPWRDGVFVQMVGSSLCLTVVFLGLFTVLPVALEEVGYPTLVYGLIVGLNGFLIAVFEVPLVELVRRRFRRLRAAALGATLIGAGWSFLGFGVRWPLVLAAMIVWTLGEILFAPFQMSFVSDWAPPAARGRYLGIYSATWSLGLALNPLIVLPLQARLPGSVFWPLLGLGVLPAIVSLLHLDRTADHRPRLRGLTR